MKDLLIGITDVKELGDKYRKYSGRAICPKSLSCPFDDCPHIKKHWRGTHCVKDRRDDCPSCLSLAGPYVKKQDRNKQEPFGDSAKLVEKNLDYNKTT